MVMLCIQSYAQNELDALRYSHYLPMGGTARSIGVAGSMGAVGADGASILSNPAGLARYRKNSFSITGGYNSVNNIGTYPAGVDLKNRDVNYSLNGLNLNFASVQRTKGKPNDEGWLTHNFSFAYQQLNNFNRTFRYEGRNTRNSYTDAIAQSVNRQGLSITDLEIELDPFRDGFDYYENMFWEAQLIDFDPASNQYYPFYPENNPNFSQFGNVAKSGGMNDFSFAYAGNYNDQFLIGFGLNITRVNYTERNVYSEDNNGQLEGWNYFDFIRNLETRGTGIGATLGAIYQPNASIRLGLSIETPKVLRLTDNYSDQLLAGYTDGLKIDYRTIDKEFSYRVTTPLKTRLQGAYIFEKKGFISAEVELADFSTMSLGSDPYDFSSENSTILTDFKPSVNFRLGGEMAFGDFRVRGGYARMGNPMNDGELSMHFVSLGGGFTDGKLFIDLALNRNMGQDQFLPYQFFSGPVVDNSFNRNMFVLTIGRRIM